MLAAGSTIAHYRITSRLGAGGMGEVYLAQDTKLDRAVALKILPPEVAGDHERMRRFVQEAKAASALNHPNVAHIYEIGEADGVHFIAMEYVEGRPLREKIGQTVETEEILDVGIQAADALDEANTKGVTHRDIKPANIMLTPRGQVKVLDFELAKITRSGALAGDADTVTQLDTVPGVVLGTVPYMSPEQALGHDVDQRSDIFSLGVVLYELATGQLPFLGATPTETISRILQAQPEPMARFHDGLPAELERIIRKCLEKDRERRYQSARELVVDLRNLKRDSDSGVAAPVLPSRRRYVLGALATGVVALGGVGAYFGVTRGRAIDSLAVLPFVNVGGDPNTEYLSDGITENLINGFSQLPKLRVVPRSRVFRYKGREADTEKIGRELNVRAVLTGRVVQRGDSLNIQTELVDVGADSQLWGRQYSRKLSEIIPVQEEIAKEVSEKLRLRPTGEDQKRLAKRYTENPEAHQLYLKGRYYWNRRSAEALQRAVEYFRHSIDKDPTYALAWAGLADSYAVCGYETLPPREAIPKAKEAAGKALTIDETQAEPHAVLGFVKSHYDWDWSGAEREFKRAIELDPNYATAHSWYGIYLAATGRPDEAFAEVRRAQEADPLSPIIGAIAGRTLYHARRYDQAIEQLRKTLELDPNFPLAHWVLGMTYEQVGRHEEALAECQRAVSPSRDPLSPLGALGHAYAVSGKRAEAQEVLAELKDVSKRRYVAPFNVALVYAGLGERSRALEWLERAYEDHSLLLASIKVWPQFDGLRGEPRFQDLLRRMNLAP